MTAERRNSIAVEVVYATVEKQWLIAVELAPGSTAQDAVELALTDKLDEEVLNRAPLGIWGRVTPRDAVVKDGDRIELYRQLRRDPREARRERAAAGGEP